MGRRAGWIARVRALGAAFLEVVRAELAALAADLAASGRTLVRALVLFAAAFAFAFWTLALAIYFLIEVLALWLPRWGAVGAVLALFALTALAFAWRAASRFRQIEAPAAAVSRRWSSHVDWWRARVVGEESGKVFPVDDDEDGEE